MVTRPSEVIMDAITRRALATVLQGAAVAITGDFETILSIGLGMRKQTWIKAATLTAPTRVVIDIGR